MDCTFIRVKRRIDESPANTLLVNLKRQKLQNVDQASSSSVFERAGYIKTVGSHDAFKSAIDLLLKDVNEAPTQPGHKKHSLPNMDSDPIPKRIKLIDVDERQKLKWNESLTCNGSPLTPAYVYDLYVWKTSEPVDGNLEGMSIFPSDYREFVHTTMSDAEDKDDISDSNSESNWRNEYPDDDDDLVHYGDLSGSEADESESDLSDHSDDHEKLNDNESELRKIKKKYSKILKIMRNEASNLDYDDLVK